MRQLRWRHLDEGLAEIRLGIEEHKAGRKTAQPRIIALSPDAATAILAGYPSRRTRRLRVRGQAGGPAGLPHETVAGASAKAARLPAGLTLHSLRHGSARPGRCRHVGDAGSGGPGAQQQPDQRAILSPYGRGARCHGGDGRGSGAARSGWPLSPDRRGFLSD